MKFLLPLLSFLLGNAKGFFKEPSVALTQQLLQHVRTLTILIVTTVGSLALSCVGLSLLISNIAQQLDRDGAFYFTPGTWLYLGMTVAFAAVLFWSLQRKTWLKALGAGDKTPPSRKGNPVENALALLLMDYLEERRSRRDKAS